MTDIGDMIERGGEGPEWVERASNAALWRELTLAELEVSQLNTECGHLQADKRELREENERLRALLEPCRPDTDAQTDASYPKTVDDVLSLLSAYIADFLPDDVCPGDEYFGAWERQARRVVGPIMQKNWLLRTLLTEASDGRTLDWVEWLSRVRESLEAKP
jgi:hypothetical protein